MQLVVLWRSGCKLVRYIYNRNIYEGVLHVELVVVIQWFDGYSNGLLSK